MLAVVVVVVVVGRDKFFSALRLIRNVSFCLFFFVNPYLFATAAWLVAPNPVVVVSPHRPATTFTSSSCISQRCQPFRNAVVLSLTSSSKQPLWTKTPFRNHHRHYQWTPHAHLHHHNNRRTRNQSSPQVGRQRAQISVDSSPFFAAAVLEDDGEVKMALEENCSTTLVRSTNKFFMAFVVVVMISFVLLGSFLVAPAPAFANTMSNPPFSEQIAPLSTSSSSSSSMTLLFHSPTRETYTSTTSSPSSTLIVTSAMATTTTNVNEDNALSEKYSMLEEVWSLIDKYYLDPTYGGQDWDQVHDKYRTLLRQHSSLPSMSSSSTTAASTSLFTAAAAPASTPSTTTTASPGDSSSSNSIEFQLTNNMVQSLHDKYSRMLDANAYAAIQKYDLIGVGVTLMPNPVTKRIQVGAPPVPHSAADLAGLQVGDYVDAVNGIPTIGRTAFDIIDQITNEESSTTTTTMSSATSGTSRTVTMTIRRPSASSSSSDQPEQVFDVIMERQFQKVNNPIKYKLTETRQGTTGDTAATKIGWIRISEFNSLGKIQLEQALQDLHDQGANAFVLDVRHNTGGAFQSAIEIASLFLQPHQVATYVVDRNQAQMPFMTTTTTTPSATTTTTNSKIGHVDSTITTSPSFSKEALVIWTDGSSASASEVLAGALRDNCRAVVMGDTSFGKGLIQAVYGLKNGGGLVLTVARYVTPKGYNIQGVGITPDIPGHVPTFSLFNALGIGDSDDTSQVDFDEVAQRLAMCQPPTPSSQMLQQR